VYGIAGDPIPLDSGDEVTRQFRVLSPWCWRRGGESYPHRAQGGERYTYSYGAGRVFEVEDGGVHHLQSVSFVEQLSCDD
jgi:hypothetical protein